MFELREKNGVKYLVIDEFEKTGLVTHAFSTRIGGVSTGETAELNFGYKRNDTKENVTRNFEIMCNTLGLKSGSLVFTDQRHGTNVRKVTLNDCGKGFLRESDIYDTDAFVTNCVGVTLVTFHADCIPVFFLDPKKRAVGLAHSGWKGTYGNISENVVEKMVSEYGTDPTDLICGIGPSILTCHFEVGNDIKDMFEERYGTSYTKMYDKPHIDLTGIVVEQLKKCGVKNIVESKICTYCNNDLFYSYRGDGQKTGSLISVMALKGKQI